MSEKFIFTSFSGDIISTLRCCLNFSAKETAAPSLYAKMISFAVGFRKARRVTSRICSSAKENPNTIKRAFSLSNEFEYSLNKSKYVRSRTVDSNFRILGRMIALCIKAFFISVGSVLFSTDNAANSLVENRISSCEPWAHVREPWTLIRFRLGTSAWRS